MKTTKWITTTLMALTLAGIAFTSNGCKSSCCAADKPSASKPSQGTQYTCSMHPEVVQNTPGNCPKCGMALTTKP